MLSSRSHAGSDTAIKVSMQDLSRLLARIQQQVFGTSWGESGLVDEQLRTSVYLRRKTGANIEHARELLLRLERDVASIKVTSRRTDWAATLRSHRATIALLNRTLISLDAISEPESDPEEPEPAAPPPTTTTTQASSLLRPRAPLPQTTDTATTSSLQTREAALTHHAREQDDIKASLLTLAGALRASNVDFSRALADERAILDAAAAGLDRNALGMESAGRRMGALRRMTEGQGWWGRVKLYALIGALWLAAFLLVFLGPKLRF